MAEQQEKCENCEERTELKTEISKDEQINHLYNAVALLTKASEELQQINGLYSFSILSQANVLLSQLKYLETGNFEGSFSTSNIPEIVPTEIKDEVDDLANEFKGDLDL